MPNSTKIKTFIEGEEFKAEVKHQKIYKIGSMFDCFCMDGKFIEFYSDDNPCSPSELVKRITKTDINAWEVLWIKTPGKKWELADDLRKSFAHIG